MTVLNSTDHSHRNSGKLAIFDLDGTLLDSMGVWRQIDEEFLAQRGITMPEDYARSISALEFREIAHYTIRRFGLDETPEALMQTWTRMGQYAYAHTVQAKPYAKEYLQYLKASGAKLAVATSLHESMRDPALKHAGLYDYFDAIVSVDEGSNNGKHTPEIYLYTANKVGVEPRDCTVFEDLLTAVRSAKAGGMRVWGVYDDSSAGDWHEIQRIADGTLRTFDQAPLQL